MGIHVETNSILRSDDAYDLMRGQEYSFTTTASRVDFDDRPIWLTSSDWQARAEIRITSQTRTPTHLRGTFRALHAYTPEEAVPLTRCFRRMFAGGGDPFIYLLMNPADYAKAVSDGVWDLPSRQTEGFIHAAPANQLTRIANKYYRSLAEVNVVSLRTERLLSEVEWEPAGDQQLYPHIFGPINFEAAEKVTTFSKNSNGLYAITLPT